METLVLFYLYLYLFITNVLSQIIMTGHLQQVAWMSNQGCTVQIPHRVQQKKTTKKTKKNSHRCTIVSSLLGKVSEKFKACPVTLPEQSTVWLHGEVLCCQLHLPNH